jgi:hypothetical protein
MRFAGLMVTVLVMMVTAPAIAANWIEYANREYGFAVNFPGNPTETDISYATASGASVGARVFSVVDGEGRYSVTVVDFSTREPDESGAIAFAAQTLRAKGEVLYDADLSLDGIPGHQMSVVEKDGRRMMAAIHLYNHRLYITEGSLGPGNMTTQQFQQSVGMIHPDGTVVNLVREGRATRPPR